MAKWLRFLVFQLPCIILVSAVRLADFRRLKLFNSSRDNRMRQWWYSKRRQEVVELPKQSVPGESTESSFVALLSSVAGSNSNKRDTTMGRGKGKRAIGKCVSPGAPGAKVGGKVKGKAPGPPPPQPAGKSAPGGTKGPPPPAPGQKAGGKGAGNANAGKPLVIAFRDGLWTDFVEYTKKKNPAKEKKEDSGKLPERCGMDNKPFQQIAFWERNPYFQKKLKEVNHDWYKAMVSTISNLCSDVQGDLRDECGGIFDFLRSFEATDEEKKGKWQTDIMDKADIIRDARQMYIDAGKKDKVCDAALALIDIYPTHERAMIVQSAAEDFLSAAIKSKKNWDEFAKEFDNVLGEEALKRAAVANCRVMPGVMASESKVSAQDCVSRLSEVVSDRVFLHSRCIALAGPRAWKEHDIPTKLWKSGMTNATATCEKVYKLPWTEENLQTTQENLACSVIWPYSLQDTMVKPLDLVDGPHYRFATELLKNRKNYLFAKPSEAEVPQRIFAFDKQEENSWMEEEDKVRKSWPLLLQAEATLLKKCEKVEGSFKDACESSKKAAAEIRKQATQMTGATEEQLSDFDSMLFDHEKNAARDVFVRILKEYHAVEDVLARAHRDKEKGIDVKEQPKSKALTELVAKSGKSAGNTGASSEPVEAAKPPVKGGKGPPPPAGKGGKAPPPPAPGKAGGKAPPPPAPGKGGKAPPPPSAKGGKGPPPPGAGKGPGGSALDSSRSFTPTDFKPEDISVWRWLEHSVKLWRVLFDDSRKERGCLVQKWSDAMPKYQKCSFMTRCIDYPDQMVSIEQENNKQQATQKKIFLRTTCTEYCRSLDVRIVDCTEPAKNKACGTPLLTKEGMADRLGDAPTTSAIWCASAPEDFKKAVFYAAAESVDEVKQSRKKPFVADVVRILDLHGSQEPTTLMEDKAVETIWKLHPDKIGEVVVRIENEKK